MQMFVKKTFQIKSEIKFDMMLLLLTYRKWAQANARRKCLHRNEELNYSKLQKKIQRGKKKIIHYHKNPRKKKSVACIQFHRSKDMCSRQLRMWTITSIGKQKNKVTVLHDINTCWVTTTQETKTSHSACWSDPFPKSPDKNGEMSSLSAPKTGQKLDRASPRGTFFSPTKCINRAKKTAYQVFT